MSNRLPMTAGETRHAGGSQMIVRVMRRESSDGRCATAPQHALAMPPVHLADRMVAHASRAAGPAALLAACAALVGHFA